MVTRSSCSLVCLLTVFSLFFLLAMDSKAAGSFPTNGIGIYLGTSQGLGFPKSYRLYWKEFEIGTFPTSYGIVKIFSDGNFYADFGAGLVSQGTQDLGVIAGVGYHKLFGIGLGLRADWNVCAGMMGYQNTDVQIGFTYIF